MSYDTVIDEIDTILKDATGVPDDNVFKYERWASNDKDYIDAFKDDSNNVIHGYVITRVRKDETPEASKSYHVITTWLIRGFYAMSSFGATENTTFQPLLDVIAAKFREDPKLNNSVLDSGSLLFDKIELLMFGSVLCHYAEMRIETVEQVTY